MPTTITTRGTSISIMATTIPITRTTTNMFDWFAVESEQAAPYFSLHVVDTAYRQCRKRKRNKVRTCLYEQALLDNLLITTEQLQTQTWQPRPPLVFTVLKPKAREVYAAQFHDRVVHHVLFNYLEPLLEKEFIYDSASNRKGRGTHFAINRLQKFMRHYQYTAQGGYFLQLDVKNFFNSIQHATLLAQLEGKLQKWLRKKRIDCSLAAQLKWLVTTIVQQPRLSNQAIRLGSDDEFARVPEHKQLARAAIGQGLPIGNLTSQLLANLYLNELDQFVKHQLKCKHYIRYVDDFVLCSTSKQQLQLWQQQIQQFLQQQLTLTLKSQFALAPIRNGADFLGYIVRPNYKLVRKRVLGNLHEKLQSFERQIVKPSRAGVVYDVQPQKVAQLRATLASYWGHFKHANSFQLAERLFDRYTWLKLLFSLTPDHFAILPRYQPQTQLRFKAQVSFFSQYYRDYCLLIQCGKRIYLHHNTQLGSVEGSSVQSCSVKQGVSQLPSWPISHTIRVRRQHEKQGIAYVLVNEQGYTRMQTKRRAVRLIWHPTQFIT